jgi:putative tryptophan/tyrosine transport system substrate-binding protein
MRRRDFFTLLGASAAAWPWAASAQQRPTVPVIGFLGSTSPVGYRQEVMGFKQGLAESGYVEGRNVAIEFRWAQEGYNRLPMLAAELLQHRVAVIVAVGDVGAPLAVKAATTTIPIVFLVGSDPVEVGLVSSFNRPGGNITGMTTLGRELLAKRLEALRELVPNVTAIGLLANPNDPNTEPSVRELQSLARAGGWVLHVVAVTMESDLDGAITTLAQQKVGAFLYATDAFFNNRRDHIVALAARHAIPVIYQDREAVVAGGLMSYGAPRADSYRQLGDYVGRILKGAKPADLPVMQPTKFVFALNLKTAKTLGLDVPTATLLRADEVVE